jgi:ribosomal protein L3
MSRIFTEDGESVPVTLIEATPEPHHPGEDRRNRRLRAVQVTAGASAPRW